jgi:hypothetical protein
MSGQTVLLGGVAVAAAVLVGLLGVQSQHAFTHEAVPLLLVPLALWLFFSERYEVTLAVLLLYLGLLDGVLKLASGSTVATLGRDIMLYAITLGAVLRMMLRKTALTLPPFTGIVLAWVAVSVMQVANPSDVSLTHAVASLRQHLEFVPLFFFGFLVLRSEHRIAGLLVLLVIVGTVNGIVDVIQTSLTPAQLSSWGPGYAILEHGTRILAARIFVNAAGQAQVRPPGLGSSDGFGGMMCLVALPGAIACLSGARRQVKFGWLVIPATMLTILGIVTSQTRLDIVGAVIAVVAFLALTITSRRGLTALLATTLVAVAGYLVLSTFIAGSANRYSSIAPSKLVSTVISNRGSNFVLIPKYIADYPLGAGLGTVGPARGTSFSGKQPPALNGESEFTFVLVETGIPGLLVILAFLLTAIRAGLALRRVAAPALQACLMALTAVLIAIAAAFFFTPATADSPTAPFLWLSGGCLAYWYGEMRAGRLTMRSRLVRNTLASR